MPTKSYENQHPICLELICNIRFLASSIWILFALTKKLRGKNCYFQEKKNCQSTINFTMENQPKLLKYNNELVEYLGTSKKSQFYED